MKTLRLITLFLLLCQVVLTQTCVCDYFGLDRPDTIAQNFNPSILDLDGSFIFNAIYNVPKCDEFYFTKIDSKENIYFSKKENGVWQSPQIAPFSNEAFHDADPFFAQDGNRVYFVSSRPINSSDTKYYYNIWYADKEGNVWGQPIVLPEPINTDYQEYFFSISNKGNAYFSSNRPGGLGSFDIYQVKISEDGSMSEPVNFGEPVNTNRYEFDPHISPDESFIIFSINNKDGFSDLYFSYKNEN